MLLLLTDSMSAVHTIRNIARGEPPRSGIEKQIALALVAGDRHRLDTGISSVRSHTGIPGNEAADKACAADKAADFQSHLGQVARQPNTATYEGLKAYGKAIRKQYRSQPGLGKGSRPLWNRRPLSAYT